jgi:hypothetical protein
MAKKKGAIQTVTSAVKSAAGEVAEVTKTVLENIGLKSPAPAKKPAKKKAAAKPAKKAAKKPAKAAAKKPAKKKAGKK